MKKKRPRRGFGVLRWGLFGVAAAVFLCSGYTLASHYFQMCSSRNLNDELRTSAVVSITPVQETAPAENAAVPPQDVLGQPETSSMEAVPETAPIEVDFTALNAKLENVVAWVYCPDTVINYPVMQAEDNQFYVKHLPNGREGYTGSIFMDYRNNADFSDYSTVIYGHNMRDGSMFAKLQKYRDPEYAGLHPVWYLLTPTAKYKVTLVAGYVVEHDSATYQVLNNQSERDELLQYALDNSCFDAQVSVPEDAPLVCFSTCAYDFTNARFVLLGSLSPLQ